MVVKSEWISFASHLGLGCERFDLALAFPFARFGFGFRRLAFGQAFALVGPISI